MTELHPEYEAFVSEDGRFELRERDCPDRWIRTDAPVECLP